MAHMDLYNWRSLSLHKRKRSKADEDRREKNRGEKKKVRSAGQEQPVSIFCSIAKKH